jgi:hypothetical protein
MTRSRPQGTRPYQSAPPDPMDPDALSTLADTMNVAVRATSVGAESSHIFDGLPDEYVEERAATVPSIDDPDHWVRLVSGVQPGAAIAQHFDGCYVQADCRLRPGSVLLVVTDVVKIYIYLPEDIWYRTRQSDVRWQGRWGRMIGDHVRNWTRLTYAERITRACREAMQDLTAPNANSLISSDSAARAAYDHFSRIAECISTSGVAQETRDEHIAAIDAGEFEDPFDIAAAADIAARDGPAEVAIVNDDAEPTVLSIPELGILNNTLRDVMGESVGGHATVSFDTLESAMAAISVAQSAIDRIRNGQSRPVTAPQRSPLNGAVANILIEQTRDTRRQVMYAEIPESVRDRCAQYLWTEREGSGSRRDLTSSRRQLAWQALSDRRSNMYRVHCQNGQALWFLIREHVVEGNSAIYEELEMILQSNGQQTYTSHAMELLTVPEPYQSTPETALLDATDRTMHVCRWNDVPQSVLTRCYRDVLDSNVRLTAGERNRLQADLIDRGYLVYEAHRLPNRTRFYLVIRQLETISEGPERAQLALVIGERGRVITAARGLEMLGTSTAAARRSSASNPPAPVIGERQPRNIQIRRRR